MEPKFNKTWLWIAIFMILNVLVFKFLSVKLEGLMQKNVDNQKTEKGL